MSTPLREAMELPDNWERLSKPLGPLGREDKELRTRSEQAWREQGVVVLDRSPSSEDSRPPAGPWVLKRHLPEGMIPHAAPQPRLRARVGPRNAFEGPLRLLAKAAQQIEIVDSYSLHDDQIAALTQVIMDVDSASVSELILHVAYDDNNPHLHDRGRLLTRLKKEMKSVSSAQMSQWRLVQNTLKIQILYYAGLHYIMHDRYLRVKFRTPCDLLEEYYLLGHGIQLFSLTVVHKKKASQVTDKNPRFDSVAQISEEDWKCVQKGLIESKVKPEFEISLTTDEILNTP